MNADPRAADNLVTTFRFGEFTFDCASRQLWCNGVERHLSPKAQQLLHLLILARPGALSRVELYDALWPSTFVCETNLASIVNETRRALGDDARQPRFIRTAHGFGYAFCPEVMATAPVAGAAILRCEASPASHASIHVLYEGKNVVGRAGGGQIVIADATVSRRHAAITLSGDVISVEDLDSKNGTFVEGERIGRLPVIVRPHTRLMFGAVVASILRRRNTSTQSLRLTPSEVRRLGT